MYKCHLIDDKSYALSPIRCGNRATGQKKKTKQYLGVYVEKFEFRVIVFFWFPLLLLLVLLLSKYIPIFWVWVFVYHNDWKKSERNVSGMTRRISVSHKATTKNEILIIYFACLLEMRVKAKADPQYSSFNIFFFFHNKSRSSQSVKSSNSFSIETTLSLRSYLYSS